jgi:steroid delta-isomerase-like uncharacterized protein
MNMKTPFYLTSFLLITWLASCQNQQVISELEVLKSQAETENQNKELVLQLYEAIDNQEFDAAIEFLAEDALIYGAGGFDPGTPVELRSIFPEWYSAFPDYTHSIEEVIAEGDKVSVRMIYTGTHDNTFFGVPGTGNSIKYLGIHTHTIRDGKVVESWVLEDMLLLWQQLGMELQQKNPDK